MIRTYSFWIRLLGGLCAMGIGFNLIWSAFVTEGQKDRRATCQNTLQNLARALQEYQQDYDDRLPPVGTPQSGWMLALLPYYGERETYFQCPATGSEAASTSDYWFNARAATVSKDKLRFPVRTLLIGEGQNDSSPNASLSQFPPAWLSSVASPLRRHLDGANFLFADGHVKWYRASNIALWQQQSGAPIFAVAP